jgi:catechol 2,3-dioxygenase-like lactoylglutathione lyase family enzyme
VAFVATAKPAKARAFCRDTLGLRLVSEDEFALVFDAHATMLRVAIVKEVAAAEYTVLGWQVPDTTAAVTRLQKSGVRLQAIRAWAKTSSVSGRRRAEPESRGSKTRMATR